MTYGHERESINSFAQFNIMPYNLSDSDRLTLLDLYRRFNVKGFTGRSNEFRKFVDMGFLQETPGPTPNSPAKYNFIPDVIINLQY